MNEWATQFGLPEWQASQIRERFQEVFTSAGVSASTATQHALDLTQLVGDLASFCNAKPDLVTDALVAALKGEPQGLRLYGPNVTTPDLVEACAEVVGQTAAIRGDFARWS